MMTTQKQVRAAFWEAYPRFDTMSRQRRVRSKSQNHQPALIRVAFVDYVDMLARNGEISQSLAERVTL